MTYTKIPENLPDCELLHVLAEKADIRRDTDFNFVGRLDEFCQRVNGEVCQINKLFPEYTPHEENYHLKRLFHVADTVLGRDRLEEMNSTELFILAVALYGHDWGMAVSDPEKQFILTGELPEGANLVDLWVLPDEQTRFANFLRNQRLITDAEGRLREISTEMWREYVRQTHAFRSGERVQRFFDHIDRGIADAASRICIGHWLDFEDLQDYRYYPSDFSVLHETVNIRALAVYVRLIDLLDLAEDRTPYVIWKFVAPRDPRSKMEWAKHRSLRPITCPPYLEGRIIRVDGSTDDHEVYAALEDLRIRCEEQVRGCNDILARMNDPRHKLDLYHIDWRVAARGFRPISSRFEFERERMFEILSDEIYQDDPYVFLRELLQNSIDAIRMRREVLQRNGISPETIGVIKVNIEHGDGGDAVITWCDDGIGMDEYIVRNYLAVAGQSYYRSTDFEREGLKMDPISRFGIGILSCFMVADRVEIDTFKDPYLPPSGEPLKITIPAMRRQFRIETRSPESTHPGTTVRVFVDGKKIPVNDKNEPAKPLDVTRYLSIVAGFVEFPIIITEGDRKTIVLHPYHDGEAARNRFGEAFNIHQIDLGYPWSQAILPQDLPSAREVLREERWDIATDLRLEDYEGVLTYLVPKDEIDLARGGDIDSLIATMWVKDKYVKKEFRCFEHWTNLYRRFIGYGIAQEVEEETSLSRSSTYKPTYAVYRDGILLPEASSPYSRDSYYEIDEFTRMIHMVLRDNLPLQQIVVNIPKSEAPRVDLARTQIIGQSIPWHQQIFEAHRRILPEKSRKNILALNPAERLCQLSRIHVFHNISYKRLLKIFPYERWPLPFLEGGGQFNVLEWSEVANDAIHLCPSLLANELSWMCHQWITKQEYKGLLVQWAGEQCLISDVMEHWQPYKSKEYMNLGATMLYAAQCGLSALNRSRRFTAIRFLLPPWEGDPPLFQEIWHPTQIPDKPPEVEAVLEKASHDPTLLDPLEREQLHKIFSRHFLGFPKVINFPYPFEQSLAYGWTLFNLGHQVTQALLRIAAALVLSDRRKTIPEDRFGIIQDALNDILELKYGLRYVGYRCHLLYSDSWSNAMLHLLSWARDLQLFDTSEIEGYVPTPNEFVPGTAVFSEDHDIIIITDLDDKLESLENFRLFGMPLT